MTLSAASAPRVLLVTGEYPPSTGGVGDYTHLLAASAHRQDIPIAVATWRGTTAREHDPDIPVHRTLEHGRRLAPSLAHLVREVRPDLLHLQYQAAAFDVQPDVTRLPDRLAREGIRLPFVTTFHDLLPPHAFPGSGRWDRRFVERLAASSSLAITGNRQDRDTMASWSRPPGRTLLVPIGSNIPRVANPTPRADLLAGLGLEPDVFAVVYFGFANRSKGLDTLIRAMARLASEDRRARLILAGDPAGDADATNRSVLEGVMAAIESWGLLQVTHRTGPLTPEAASAWLQAADSVVLPYADGWSWRRGSLLAALHNGASTITTDPGPRDDAPLPALQDGRDALLVPPGDPAALRDALERLREDPALAGRIRSGARETAAVFGWDDIARAHQAAWSGVLA